MGDTGTERILTGGCLCGRVRYRLRTARLTAGHCHCNMCRKATGGATGLFVTVPAAALEWTAGRPRSFASSRIATRGFCADCGSPLTYSFNGDADIDVTLGSLDTPELLRASHHVGVESRLPGFAFHDGLPCRNTADNAQMAAAWTQAYGPDIPMGPEFRPDKVNE